MFMFGLYLCLRMLCLCVCESLCSVYTYAWANAYEDDDADGTDDRRTEEEDDDETDGGQTDGRTENDDVESDGHRTTYLPAYHHLQFILRRYIFIKPSYIIIYGINFHKANHKSIYYLYLFINVLYNTICISFIHEAIQVL